MTTLAQRFDAMPSWRAPAAVSVTDTPTTGLAVPDVDVVGVPVDSGGGLPDWVGIPADRVRAAGFEGNVGQALAVPAATGPTVVLYGLGDPAQLDAAVVRNAAAGFARAAGGHARLAVILPTGDRLAAESAAQAVVEGVLLARYRYTGVRAVTAGVAVTGLTVRTSAELVTDAQRGADRGSA
jgi:leucyl aminopeptidase